MPALPVKTVAQAAILNAPGFTDRLIVEEMSPAMLPDGVIDDGKADFSISTILSLTMRQAGFVL